MTSFNTNSADCNESALPRGVFQLRECGTDQRHPLPLAALRCRLGTADSCAVRLTDPEILPLHAQLTRERQRWLVRALGDEPGLWCDGARSNAFSLEPGVQICIGQTTLIAEDERWAALHAYCSRLLGWAPERRADVDRALRAIRMSLTHRAPLALRGDADMVPIARALHRRVLGADRPFVVCDPRRRNGADSVRSARNVRDSTAAVRAAAGGSLCVRARRPPRDFPALLAALREPGGDVQLIVCLERDDAPPLLSAPIEVPPLASRAGDLPRIIDEYALDAIAALGALPASFQPEDQRSILEQAPGSLSEIEKATLRCVALRSSVNMSRAAARLGMAPVSLSRWLARRSRIGSEHNDAS